MARRSHTCKDLQGWRHLVGLKNCMWFTLSGAQDAKWSQELQREGRAMMKEFTYYARIVAFSIGGTFQTEEWDDQILCFRKALLVSMVCREKRLIERKEMSQKRGKRAGSKEGEADTSPAIQNNRSPLLLSSSAAIPRLAWGLLSTRGNFSIARVSPPQRCAPVVGAFATCRRSRQLPSLVPISCCPQAKVNVKVIRCCWWYDRLGKSGNNNFEPEIITF